MTKTDRGVHSSSSSPHPVHKNAHTHTPSSLCPLLRSHEDKEGRRAGIRATGKQARNRVEVVGVPLETPGQRGSGSRADGGEGGGQ